MCLLIFHYSQCIGLFFITYSIAGGSGRATRRECWQRLLSRSDCGRLSFTMGTIFGMRQHAHAPLGKHHCPKALPHQRARRPGHAFVCWLSTLVQDTPGRRSHGGAKQHSTTADRIGHRRSTCLAPKRCFGALVMDNTTMRAAANQRHPHLQNLQMRNGVPMCHTTDTHSA